MKLQGLRGKPSIPGDVGIVADLHIRQNVRLMSRDSHVDGVLCRWADCSRRRAATGQRQKPDVETTGKDLTTETPINDQRLHAVDQRPPGTASAAAALCRHVRNNQIVVPPSTEKNALAAS